MRNDRHYSLPLFINGNEPVQVYVFNDQVLGFELIGNYYSNPYHTFRLLGALGRNEIATQEFPATLWERYKQHFEKMTIIDPCLCGYREEWFSNRCLAVKMVIEQEAEEQPVRFYDVALLESGDTLGVFVNSYPGEVRLTIKEAFLLLSNICLTSIGVSLCYGKTAAEPYDFPLTRGQMQEKYKNIKEDVHYFGYKDKLFDEYSVDYIEYILDQIRRKEITLEEILRLSGAHLLVEYLHREPAVQSFIKEKKEELLSRGKELEEGRKITYTTLVLLAKWSDLLPELGVHDPEENQVLEKLTEELLKKFPCARGEKRTLAEVYSYYSV